MSLSRAACFGRYCLLLLASLLSTFCLARPALAADWAQNFGLAGSNAVITATAVDSAGNTYVAGYFDGATLTLGATMLTRIGTQDAFAAKPDAGGTVQWAQNYGGSGAAAYAYAYAIAVDASGNVYLGGEFDSADLATPALNRIGARDAFALKLDAGGTTTWAQNYGGSVADAYALAVDASGNVYLGGAFFTANLTTPALTLIGTQDAFLLTGATAVNFGANAGTALTVNSATSITVTTPAGTQSSQLKQ